MFFLSSLLISTYRARIRLHRISAFSNVPLFAEKYCDIDGILADGELSLSPRSQNDSSTSPFTSQKATVACLKSSLAVARALRRLSEGLSDPSNLNLTDHGEKPKLSPELTTSFAVSSKEISGSLPYFRCAGMQACYSLFMILHQIHAALSSKSLSNCYYLLGASDPSTEIQDARRLIEEVRHGIECMRMSLKMDMGFDAIAAMSREVDTAYSCFFLA